MVDLSRHFQSAKQATDRGQYDYAIAKMEECVEVEPAQLEIYRIHLDAARRKAKITTKGMFSSVGMPTLSKDPHKLFAAMVRKVGKDPGAKILVEAADAARVLSATVKGMTDVAIFFYEEFRRSGLFNDKALWSLATMYFERFKAGGGKEGEVLEKALATMTELDKAMPSHPEAGRTVKNWLAIKSSLMRNSAQSSSGKNDFTGQVANTDQARRMEVLNRMIRTPDDAREVLSFLDRDLTANAGDKQAWVKKGNIHLQFGQLDEARAAFAKAQEIDPHDFTIAMRSGEVAIADAQRKVAEARQAKQDASLIAALEGDALRVETEELRRRVERQPTDMNHRFQLGVLLFKGGSIEGAAAEFQKTVNDPRLRRASHKNLGACFQKKNLLDLAVDQYNSFLRLVEDDSAEDAKGIRYQLARLLETLGKTGDAIEQYTRLVTIDLSFKDAADRLNSLRTPSR